MKEYIFIVSAFSLRKKQRKFFAYEILGKTFLNHIFSLTREFSPEKIFLVLDKESESLKDTIKEGFLPMVVEKLEQIFTEISSTSIINEKDFVFLRTEYPLISIPTLKALIKEHSKKKNAITVLTHNKKIPALVFNGKALSSIDKIQFKRGDFETFMKSLILFFSKRGEKIGEFSISSDNEFLLLEEKNISKIIEVLRLRKIEEIQNKGVKILDSRTSWIDMDVKIGKGTVIYPFTVIEGKTFIGKRCFIYPFSYIKDCEIFDDVRILTSSVLEGARIMGKASIGPYSRIRPGTVIEPKARIGNFVEVKNTIVGKRSKALHLTYLGDAKIGADVNVGAGTITCNFDGKNKNPTIIESGAFIGSGTELVAPVKIGKSAYIGAGSTITKDVPPYALGIARERQTNIAKWVKRKKK